jgi:archaellum component FlaC
MKILYTNNTLANAAGTEISLFEACLGMSERGHTVAAYSKQLGYVSDRMRQMGILVIDDLNEVPWIPDVVHGHHEWETSSVALFWPEVPIISFCRGSSRWEEEPCLSPNVVFFVAVDQDCKNRLLKNPLVDDSKIKTILNGVDLKRFNIKKKYSKDLKRALIFSNYATQENFIPIVRDACLKNGIALDVVGKGVKNTIERPEDILGEYDVVFAKGRAALEALACGCAVVVADVEGLGPYVNADNFEEARNMSFGFPLMKDSFSIENVMNRLHQYKSGSHEAFVAAVRETLNIERTLDELEVLYSEVSRKIIICDGSKISRYAADLMTRETLTYKLGKKIIEINYKSKNDNKLNIDSSSEFDKIYDLYANNFEKLERLKRRSDRLRIELDKAKEQIRVLKQAKTKSGKNNFFKKLFKW